VQPPSARSTDRSNSSRTGRGRECVEIARRILKEARRGVRLDEMAILVRSPHSYFGLLEHALVERTCARWFDRGTRGRTPPAALSHAARLRVGAIVASRFANICRSAGSTAARWGRRGGLQGRSRHGRRWAASADEALGLDDAKRSRSRRIASEIRVSGHARAPWRWERVIVDAAVIGRIGALVARLEVRGELERQRREPSASDGPDSARARGRLDRWSRSSSCGFALPIVEELASGRSRHVGRVARSFRAARARVLRMPAYVLRVLADLRPMAAVGPIDWTKRGACSPSGC
jgi:hypothetical protein